MTTEANQRNPMLKPIYIQDIGLAAPGLESWQQARPVLRDDLASQLQALDPEPLPRYKPQLLPANERRRATELVRLVFNACEQIADKQPEQIKDCATVFASSGGDYQIVDQVCRSLATPEKAVSPTQFHNSVHNSAAGYWSIAVGATGPSTSLAGGDNSFALGLLEAVTLCHAMRMPVLYACYDISPPEPLYSVRKITAPFCVALLLSNQLLSDQPVATVAQLQLNLEDSEAPSAICNNLALEALRQGNPAARSLPLLQLLAAEKSEALAFSLGYGKTLQARVTPC